ncbi:MAG: MarR family transcriptional regulator [Pseudomonadota bacterium]
MQKHEDMSDQVIIALRRVIRAVDLHSRTLSESHGLTGPQALILKVLRNGCLAAGVLAAGVRLSQGTVTDILNRLEQRGLVKRQRDTQDRRRVLVAVTKAGIALLDQSPPLLQERFAQRFNELRDWEQTQLLASLQRIAEMMDAEGLDASPILSSGSVRATAQAIEGALAPEAASGSQLPVSEAINRLDAVAGCVQ